MFKPVPMLYLRAVVLSRDERPVLRGLGDLGVVHTIKAEAGPETAPIAPPDNAAERGRCDALVARIDALLESFAAETGAAPAETADAAPSGKAASRGRRLFAHEMPKKWYNSRCRH